MTQQFEPCRRRAIVAARDTKQAEEPVETPAPKPRPLKGKKLKAVAR